MLAAFLRHGSNALLALATFAILFCAAAGHPGLYVGAIACGIGLFFASEYGTHRFLLHAPPSPVAFVRVLQHRLHYDHHLEPERLDLLFLPPWFLVPALAAFAAIYAALTRDAAIVVSLVLGNLLGLLYYEWVHFVAHVPFRPVTPAGRWMRKYHLRHHFKNEKLGFGVTNPLFDLVSRTYAGRKATGRSETTRMLY